MKAQADSPEDGMVISGGPLDNGGKTRGGPAGTPGGLPPERLAELRQWIASRAYANPQMDLLIAKRLLEQGDL